MRRPFGSTFANVFTPWEIARQHPGSKFQRSVFGFGTERASTGEFFKWVTSTGRMFVCPKKNSLLKFARL